MPRIAIVKKDKCVAGTKCPWICVDVCPINRAGKECIVKGPDVKPIINEELCIGCGICVKKCPTQALDIVNLPEELDKPPIHQFGRNGFHLYNLPTPMFGKVVGILGRNGIGKSTAVQILGGLLVPNLGEWERAPERDYSRLIDYFKGSEAQHFFEKVRDGEITISFKPQQVDQIPKVAEGTVKELLSKMDETGRIKEIVERLELGKFLDNKVSEISGGELQRVAIAACVLRKANLYIFDEPTSYLDIKQRIKVSKFLRTLADADTAVLVVEHDLIILDYMTDLVHIMYGKPGSYGIVSQPKTNKAGINIYLQGYLRDENIRFRSKPIRFMAKPPIEVKRDLLLTGWKGVAAKLGRFALEAKGGDLYRQDTVGVLGENGIGKTTFVKILAGEIKADTGEIPSETSVAYKPQYIGADDTPVTEALKDVIGKYEVQLVRPLELQPLYDKTLAQLSGGELQRVAIARCLAQEADLYLLDEPSAYLDVEQRLQLGSIIAPLMQERGASALIVDHDLLVIDYLSDRLLVFFGEPAVRGDVQGPFTMAEGMNQFLTDLNITMRRDQESHRPRVNKEGSQMDQKQKNEKKLYYS